MARQRDYHAEYQRRIQRGLQRELSRRQARGHPGVGEASVSRRPPPRYDRRLEEGLKAIRDGKTLREAARSIHAAPETLRSYIVGTGVAEKPAHRWRIGADARNRIMPLFSGGRQHTVTVDGYDTAFQIGRYMAAVSQFLDTNDPTVLDPFDGQSVTDIKGRQYVFETRPNVLYRLSQSGNEPFEQVYRIVV